VYCEIHPCTITLEDVRKLQPDAIVMSGGPQSVYDPESPTSDPGIFDLGVSILGICYGEQLMAKQLGGRVEASPEREYGPAILHITESIGLFAPFAANEELTVWMSHGDRLVEPPPGFRRIAFSDGAPLAAIACPERRIYGIQFHPEVAHTPRGSDILRAFLFDVAGLSPTWTPGSFSDQAVADVANQVGKDESVICGLSGGVDSTVAAVLCQKALGERLVCIFVDNGLLRAGERESVEHTMRSQLHLNLIVVGARRRNGTGTETKNHRARVYRSIRRAIATCAKCQILGPGHALPGCYREH